MEHTKPSRSKKKRIQPIVFDLVINSKMYTVNATPFPTAAGDILYRISYNNGPVHVFGWDEGLDRYAETDMEADIIPPVIELAISSKLNEYASQMQHAA
ncbi:MAG: hypothetical protein ABJB86_18100 [Bacteroidota bacterium]